MPSLPRLRLPGAVQKNIGKSNTSLSSSAIMKRSHAAISARPTKQAKTKTNTVKRNRYNIRHVPPSE